MNRRMKEKYLKIFVPLLVGLIFILLIWVGYKLIFGKKLSFLETIDKSVYADINYDAIYGIHLNFKGSINLPENYHDMKLVLANGKDEIEIPIEVKEKDGKREFVTSNFINKGINLEYLPVGTYYLLIKASTNENNKEVEKYFSVTNKTDYDNLEYYTLTKNGKNNKIDIEWNTYEECPTLRVTVKETSLPSDVYDITIDPGHGGVDTGAIGYLDGVEYRESNLNLTVSLALKKILEERGYKVAITRSSDENIEIYEKGGSAVLANETKSKFNFALHHNSFEYQTEELNGLEVYVASDIEFDFANLLIENIIKETGTQISPKEIYQTVPGIYQRYFSEDDIAEDEVQPSNKTTSMIYYYNIRELGGISTHSTNDGRYKDINGYPANPYYNANVTTEPYLLELGYVNNEENLRLIVGNEEKYALGIANAIEKYLEINY